MRENNAHVDANGENVVISIPSKGMGITIVLKGDLFEPIRRQLERNWWPATITIASTSAVTTKDQTEIFQPPDTEADITVTIDP